ncbi:MAG: hypothetical protein RL329_397 [Bacteroidota bacterium]|jgi:gliding motility-associated protein GldC
MDKKIKKTSEIKIKVGLNEEKMPVQMTWSSSDNAQGAHPQECKAMLLALFDKDSKDTLKIDLWTKDMQVSEMDRFFFQTLKGLADTYYRATQNKELASVMQQFAGYFGEQTEIIPRM